MRIAHCMESVELHIILDGEFAGEKLVGIFSEEVHPFRSKDEAIRFVNHQKGQYEPLVGPGDKKTNLYFMQVCLD